MPPDRLRSIVPTFGGATNDVETVHAILEMFSCGITWGLIPGVDVGTQGNPLAVSSAAGTCVLCREEGGAPDAQIPNGARQPA